MSENTVVLSLPACEGDTPEEAVEDYIAQSTQTRLFVYAVTMEDGREFYVDRSDNSVREAVLPDFDRISRHLGHEIEVADYAGHNAAIECVTCSEVIVDADA